MKRFRAFLAALVAFALCSAFGASAFASEGEKGGDGSGASTRLANDATTVADAATMDNWKALMEYDTSNIGRIWTDKSVSADNSLATSGGVEVEKGDSAFITALSALSSTSNISSTATTPLDIVLVLDASGSMDDKMGNGNNEKRIDALKDAANAFIDEIAKQNAATADSAMQHQVAIVKFSGNSTAEVGNNFYELDGNWYNYSQVMKTMSVCTAGTSSDFKAQINAIEPCGATRADYGLQLAQGQTSGRDGSDGSVAAKKIVVFFTDGSPTSWQKFEDGVASSAVASAKTMKDAGAVIYSIGIFSGASPTENPAASGVDKTNKFMEAVSSDYPGATYSQGREGYSWNFGNRAANASFYKTATNADELKKVFEDISKEIVSDAGYPTKTTEGAELKTGFITFNDPLGAYMQVDDVKAIVVNGQKFEGKIKSTRGNVVTYSFGKSTIINNASVALSNVLITVTTSEDPAVGDVVQVKIPAGMIPLRYFDVDENSMTMSVTDTYPMAVFYTSSLKDKAKELLANPDDAMSAYLKANSSEGKATFLSNAWSGDEYLGDTVASFEPSPANKYYYFTEDVPIYTDEACSADHRATGALVDGETYWYKNDYYFIDGKSGTLGKCSPTSEAIPFTGGLANQFNGAIGQDDEGQLYFKTGTARLNYINDLYSAKKANATSTAQDVLNPKWNDTSVTSKATMVESHLGNNGKLSVELPGTLAISKQLELPDGYSANDFANEEFEFTVESQAAASKEFKAEVKDAKGQTVKSAITSIKFNAEGKAKLTLKPGETVYIYGLDANSVYAVSETSRDGFTATLNNAEGTIAAGVTSEVKAANTYEASGTLEGETALAGAKIVTGRDWNKNDRFVFQLKAVGATSDAPLPDDHIDGIDDPSSAYVALRVDSSFAAGAPKAFCFGDITYKKPGTYTYEIWESKEHSTIQLGMSESQALYRVTVTVVDEGHNGTLNVSSAMTQLFDDDGKQVSGEAVKATSAVFTNEYNTATVKWGPTGTKSYTDATGAHGLVSDMFHVAVYTDNSEAPLPKGEGIGDFTHADADGTTLYGVVTTVKENGTIVFPQATYRSENAKDYTYTIVEVVQKDGAWIAVKDALQAPDYTLNGMKYDPTVWTVNVKVTSNDNVLDLAASYAKDGVPQEGASAFTFSNSYEPAPATATIEGSKTFTGRDMTKEESFGFALEAADKATAAALDGNGIQVNGSTEATVSRLKAGDTANFKFGEMTFSKPGTYSFKMIENAYNRNALPSGSENGITFDRHGCLVKVEVTDSGEGSLEATVAYEGDNNFANSYKAGDATFDTANFKLSKVLEGRDWIDGFDSFTFAIEALDGAPMPKDAAGNDVSTVTVDRRNASNFSFGTLTFTSDMLAGQANATRDFVYKVKEVVPDDASKLPGMTYSTNVATITVTVSDNGKGELAVSAVATGAEFKNSYATELDYTAMGGLSVAKTLFGRDATEGQFGILVKPNDEASAKALGMPAEGETIAMPKASDGQQVKKDVLNGKQVVFNQSDAGKTYAYTVSEVGEAPSGYTYDKVARTVSIAVSDDPRAAALTVATTVSGGSEGTQTFVYTSQGTSKTAVVPFYNRYSASTKVPVCIAATKTLTGRTMVEGEFSFAVKYANGNDNVLTAVNAADGAVTFGNLSYDTNQLADLVSKGCASKETVDGATTWTVNYVAYEVTDGLFDKGITAQTQPISFAVAVTDNGDGTLSATTSTGAALQFTNNYATATVDVSGMKNLVELIDGEAQAKDIAPFDGQFTFTLTSDDPLAPKPANASVTNDANGKVDFGSITFTMEDLNRVVPVAKSDAASNGKADGAASATVDEPVQAAGEVAEPAVSEPVAIDAVNNGAAVSGEATAPASDEAGVAAEMEADSAETEGAIEMMSAPASEPVATQAATVEQASSTDAMAVAAAPAKAAEPAEIQATDDVDAAQGAEPVADQATPRSYIFVYKVTESGSVKYVTNDPAATKTVKIRVADDGQGNLTAEVVRDKSDDPAFAFTNTYKYDPKPTTSSVTGQVAVTKALTGRAMSAGEFKFELLEDGNVVATGTNDANGIVAMDAITYEEPNTHHYTLREVGAGTTKDGVTYDGTSYEIVTEIVDNNGALEATHTLKNATAATFTNAYAAEPTSVTLNATKALAGKDLQAGQFTFLLTGEDGSVAKATNAADGTVTFAGLTFDKPGTYRYTLSEENDGQANVAYDGRTYRVTVTVTDDMQGHLQATVASDGDVLKFRNSYTEPPAPSPTPQPEPQQPTRPKHWFSKTGDGVAGLVPVALTLGAAAAAVVAVCAIRRKRS